MKFVGRSEMISFPSLGIDGISAKIDTGAYGNSLHVDFISVSEKGISFSCFEKEYLFAEYRTVSVKNSFGVVQERYSIDTQVSLGAVTYMASFSLADRKKMKHPALIGRRFLKKFGYIVDVSKKNLNDKAQQS